MKCLIVKEPFASRIINGEKPVEFRSRPTNIRGRIGIIASGSRGKVIGTVEVTGCEQGENGLFHWKLANPHKFSTPHTFTQPQGCVTWVKCDTLVSHET